MPSFFVDGKQYLASLTHYVEWTTLWEYINPPRNPFDVMGMNRAYLRYGLSKGEMICRRIQPGQKWRNIKMWEGN